MRIIPFSWSEGYNKLAFNAVWTTGVGFLSGRTINMIDRWLHPVKSALGKPPLVNPIHGAICGFTFVLVDALAYHLLEKYLPRVNNLSITKAGRTVVSIALSAVIAGSFLSVSMSMAAVLISVNVLATTLLISIGKTYTKLVHTKKPAVAEKPPGDPPKKPANPIEELIFSQRAEKPEQAATRA